jgi:hypothetical protein
MTQCLISLGREKRTSVATCAYPGKDRTHILESRGVDALRRLARRTIEAGCEDGDVTAATFRSECRLVETVRAGCARVDCRSWRAIEIALVSTDIGR